MIDYPSRPERRRSYERIERDGFLGLFLRRILTICLVFAVLVLALPVSQVYSEDESWIAISDFRADSRVAIGSDIGVTFTVVWSGKRMGGSLMADVEYHSGTYVDGTGGSPSCHTMVDRITSVPKALCSGPLAYSQGRDTIVFALKVSSVGHYEFAAVATLLDERGNGVYSYKELFEVEVTSSTLSTTTTLVALSTSTTTATSTSSYTTTTTIASTSNPISSTRTATAAQSTITSAQTAWPDYAGVLIFGAMAVVAVVVIALLLFMRSKKGVPPAPAPAISTKFCMHRGAKIPRGSDFCQECGARLVGNN